MSNKAISIRTYEDLEREEQRLTARLATLKQTMKEDIEGVKAATKEKLNPLKKIKETVRNLFVREDENGPAINFALNFALDFIIRLFIPNRTNVFTKTVIPFITKNYVSHLITDEQRQSVMKVVNGVIAKADNFIRKTMQKRQETQGQEPQSYRVEPAFTPAANVDTNPMNL
jgi:hypothetical protein